MLPVSDVVKEAYLNTSIRKDLIITFPDLNVTVDPDTVYSESMKLTEAIMDRDSIEFVGCIPSKFSVQIQDFGEDVKGQEIIAQLATEGTEDEPVTIFVGVVDSITQQSNKRIKEVVAYDYLYTKGNEDVAEWYKARTFPMTIRNFRYALFEYLGIEQIDIELPNDEIGFAKQYSPVNMKALEVIRAICQINGVFGMMTRDNKFEYRRLNTDTSTADVIDIGFYKSLDYQEFQVRPVDTLTIRQSETDEGVSYGSGGNTYIIQGNFFTLNLDDDTRYNMVRNLYPHIVGLEYTPFKADNVGFPYIECGDIVRYQVYDFDASQEAGEDIYRPMVFYVFSRYMAGIQALRDEYEAEGEEYQSVFITDLQSRIDALLDQMEGLVGSLQDYSLNYVIFSNTKEVDIKDGETKLVAETKFATTKAMQVTFQMEYLIQTETTEVINVENYECNDLVAKVQYSFDDLIIDSRIPIETYQDGEHILTLIYTLSIKDAQVHNWSVRITAEGGNIVLPIFQGLNIIAGQGLVGDIWDGAVYANDEYAPHTFAFLGSYGDSVQVGVHVPVGDSASDTFNPFTFNFIKVFSDAMETHSGMIMFAYGVGDTTTTWTCQILNNTWSGPGEVQMQKVHGMNSITVHDTTGCKYLMSFDDGATYYGYRFNQWTQDEPMYAEDMNGLTPDVLLGTDFIIKAVLDNQTIKLGSIEIFGGELV